MNTPVDSPQSDKIWRANPVFWIMLALPAGAVVAGLATLAISLRYGDPPLPADYHWEGQHLDADFAKARNAAAHGIEVSFAMNAAAGECRATVRAAPDAAPTLTLLFANSADAGLDRVVLLRRVAAGEYLGTCQAIPAGHWRVALEGEQWSLRTQVAGSVERITLRAHSPDGGS